MKISPNCRPRSRHDGWTPIRRAAFLSAIGCGARVIDAAREAGMSRESAYRLRRRAPGFAACWIAANADADAAVRAANPIVDRFVKFGGQVRSVAQAYACDRALMRAVSSLGEIERPTGSSL